MLIDPIAQTNSSNADDESSSDERDNHAMQTDQDDQVQAAAPPSATSPSSRRPRYRLVVYFEERDLQEDTTSSEAAESENEPTGTPNRPSRYVAIFSVDSDDQNMPVIHSAGLQNSPANFDDILNQLFNSYVPKGTPPAKQDIIDTLPTSNYSACYASQPKCAVCLEDFEEGAEMAELPCSHRFHGESCVKPWLKMHNSCPVCRYEMPVDDVEYEQNRKVRMAGRERGTNIENDTQPGASSM
jgi:hypothetical protein